MTYDFLILQGEKMLEVNKTKTNLISLSEISQTNPNLFRFPTEYAHLGLKWPKQPTLIDLSKIKQLDNDNNVGREDEHTNDEIEQLVDSYSMGIKTWEDLLIVSPNEESEVKFDYDLRAGFGTIQALRKLKVKEYWCWIVTGTPVQLMRLSSLENTKDLLTVKFPTGEDGIVHHIKKLIAQGVKIDNDDDVEREIDKVWPTLNKTVRGRVKSNISKVTNTPRRFRTWNDVKVSQWLAEEAAVTFKIGGELDTDRNMVGYTSQNLLDPFHNAIMQYAKTGKKSYVVLSTKLPGKKSTLKSKRLNHINKLETYFESYKKAGLKINPLVILGFMPQDKKYEDMRYLVNIDGLPIK